MTNYVMNRWEIEGAEADLDAFERLLLTDPGPAAPPPRLVDRLLGWAALPSGPPPRAPDFDRLLPAPQTLAPRELGEWMAAHWVTSRPAEAQSYARAGGRACLEFATAWSHPEGVVAALALRLPPALVVTGLYVEPGNEVAGRFRMTGGRVEDEELPFTAAFFEEVTGEPYDDG